MNFLYLGYVALTLLIAIILLYGYSYAMTKTGVSYAMATKRLVIATIGLCLWWGYAFLLARMGILSNYGLPPRFPIFLILPVFIFTGILLYYKRNSAILHAIPPSWPVYYQSFRILIESLFVATVAVGALHQEVTVQGYNYDMLFAFSAPIVGLSVFQFRWLPRKVALFWNYIGLFFIAIILILFTTTVFFPAIWGQVKSLASPEFGTFPYILVPGFLMPSAVFVHIISIVQLRKEN